MDNELFKLCKSVYEKTGWDDTTDQIDKLSDPMRFNGEGIEYDHIPLYTSDYLLEKLPKRLVVDGKTLWFSLYPLDRNSAWGTGYADDVPNSSDKYGEWADGDKAPLKALLKLTLALAEAGELPNEPKKGIE